MNNEEAKTINVPTNSNSNNKKPPTNSKQQNKRKNKKPKQFRPTLPNVNEQQEPIVDVTKPFTNQMDRTETSTTNIYDFLNCKSNCKLEKLKLDSLYIENSQPTI